MTGVKYKAVNAFIRKKRMILSEPSMLPFQKKK